MAVADELRELRLRKQLSQQQIVEVIRLYHPKFDKTTLSKAERGDDYGVIIKRKALDALYRVFAPELLPAAKKDRGGHHRLRKSILCRLPDYEHAELLQNLGDETVQEWLAETVCMYNEIKRKERNEISKC